MCRKKVKKKRAKDDKKSSQEQERSERVLWRPFNPYPLP